MEEASIWALLVMHAATGFVFFMFVLRFRRPRLSRGEYIPGARALGFSFAVQRISDFAGTASFASYLIGSAVLLLLFGFIATAATSIVHRHVEAPHRRAMCQITLACSVSLNDGTHAAAGAACPFPQRSIEP